MSHLTLPRHVDVQEVKEILLTRNALVEWSWCFLVEKGGKTFLEYAYPAKAKLPYFVDRD